tara:strand:- start:2301 stop:3062 length:762 start_codon:yes stop_codon:yes gene_type:complete
MEIIKKFIFLILKFITIINYLSVKKKYKKIIFLHIPHCGGNTIHRFLKINFGLRGKKISVNIKKELEIIEDGNKHFYNFGHFGFDFLKENFDNKNYFYILNARNPKNFYLSNYFRDKKYNKIYTPDERYPTLEEYLKQKIAENKDNIFCRYLSGLFIYQTNDMKMDDNIYQKALKNLDYFNFFFILENSYQSFKILPKKLKIPINYSSIFSMHANKHSNSGYPQISTDEFRLLESMVKYDNKLYEIILKKNNL